jgi:exopolysaccharide biosynthesis WecB/TagA/CpsF family protein
MRRPADVGGGCDRAALLSALAGRVARVATAAEAEALIDRLARPDRPTVLAFANAHAANLAWRDPAFADALMAADVVLRDGAGMAILCRAAGLDPGLNMNGTDLLPRLLGRFAGRRVMLVGTCEPWLSRAAERLRADGVEVVATVDGFQPRDAYPAAVRAAAPDFVVLGLGMPRQEALARHLASALDRPCLIAAGGAILDFWAGRFPRAPSWMRRAGVEWVYRLLREPKRLWRRYLIDGPAIFPIVWRWARSRHRSRP